MLRYNYVQSAFLSIQDYSIRKAATVVKESCFNTNQSCHTFKKHAPVPCDSSARMMIVSWCYLSKQIHRTLISRYMLF